MKLKIHYEDIKTIYSKEEILNQIETISNSIAAFYNDLPVDYFFQSPLDGGWSPEKNIRHLIKSTQPIYLGLSSPKVALLLFGSGKDKSRTMSEIKSAYLAKIDAGGGAGIFTPVRENTTPDMVIQQKLIQDFTKLFGKYKKQIENWKEEDLEKYKMPHPLLGNLTVREMVLFSIYHLFHHTEKVEHRFS
ncbi:MAG TPA: DinB family protein [Leptospiraceae bacterium]|nr:DinB family protein [Leptospiraceae bacterium]HMW07355.1 DinB family protein [Leptospiraceae bacterium]HMX34391.1 DinB family protein [Leptospiraceae bacterium]HMY32937.1 DinB family protein [Leptospiraceae bacterium]HMZ64551.1 DinB family protein [Leptospiraceae bacterium]